MPTASLEQVEVRALVPRTVQERGAERIRRALGTPLTDAVPAAFDALDDLDPGAYWVIREVRASVRVPASEPDPVRSAGAIARAMAGAVADVVLRGPSAQAVRFADRAAYLAAYLHVRLGGSSQGWVFERMAPLAALPPLDAVPAAARLLEVDLLAAVTALARAGDWDRLLETADAAAVARCWAVLARLPEATGAVDLSVVAAIAMLREATTGARGRTLAHRRLRLLGSRAQTASVTIADIAAVAHLEREEGDPDAGTDARSGATPSEVVGAGSGSGSAAGGAEATPPGASESAPAGASALRCAGAVAFLLLADLAEVLESEESVAWLLQPEPAAGEVRAAALAAVIGRGLDRDDVAVRLAAGVETAPDDLEPVTFTAFTDPVLARSHPDDDRWFAPVCAAVPGIEPLARALARRFAAHLHGFAATGLPYLADRVMPLGGSIRLTEDAVLVDLPRPPLHVLLAMAGLDAFTYRVPWLELPVLLTHEEEW